MIRKRSAGLFQLSSIDTILLLAESSRPLSTVFCLSVEYINGVPNAVTASGPPRELPSQFREFLRAMELMQILQNRGDLRFGREETLIDLDGPFTAVELTPAALMEADKNGYHYRERPDHTWMLTKTGRRLALKLSPEAVASPEVAELCQLLHLRPGLSSYEIVIGGGDVFSRNPNPERLVTLSIFPRSVVQMLFYLAHGVNVPPEHWRSGILQPTFEPDGQVFDWQQGLGGLFTVHSSRKHCRPKCAWVAVRYRDYWFYIDDRDNDSKITFTLMAIAARTNLLGVRKGNPNLTLPVGR